MREIVYDSLYTEMKIFERQVQYNLLESRKHFKFIYSLYICLQI